MSCTAVLSWRWGEEKPPADPSKASKLQFNVPGTGADPVIMEIVEVSTSSEFRIVFSKFMWVPSVFPVFAACFHMFRPFIRNEITFRDVWDMLEWKGRSNWICYDLDWWVGWNIEFQKTILLELFDMDMAWTFHTMYIYIYTHTNIHTYLRSYVHTYI